MTLLESNRNTFRRLMMLLVPLANRRQVLAEQMLGEQVSFVHPYQPTDHCGFAANARNKDLDSNLTEGDDDDERETASLGNFTCGTHRNVAGKRRSLGSEQ